MLKTFRHLYYSILAENPIPLTDSDIGAYPKNLGHDQKNKGDYHLSSQKKNGEYNPGTTHQQGQQAQPKSQGLD